jgi:disulfide bond formation protein DsbB
MTLIYSEVFGFIPCGLCWLERIFLYPQVILLGVALATKDKVVSKYGIALSIPGMLVSLYQHYLQMGGAEFITCPVIGAGADCAERILFEFGFMTFPLMSAFLFAFLIALYLYILKTR